MNPVRRGAGISKGTMRTAITFAKTHAGIVTFLSDNTVPVGQQREEFKAMKGSKTHPDYAEVEFWESGAGCTGRIRFSDPNAKQPTTEPAKAPEDTQPQSEDANPAEQPSVEPAKVPEAPSKPATPAPDAKAQDEKPKQPEQAAEEKPKKPKK